MTGHDALSTRKSLRKREIADQTGQTATQLLELLKKSTGCRSASQCQMFAHLDSMPQKDATIAANPKHRGKTGSPPEEDIPGLSEK